MRANRAEAIARVTGIRTDRRTAVKGLGGGALGLAATAGLRRAAAQEVTPIPVQTESDIVFGTVDGTDLLLDVNRPAESAAPTPAVIVIHGGGLFQGDRYNLGEAALALAGAGYATFSIEYRLFSPETGANPWPAQLDDVQRAVRWVRANATTYNVDPDRVASFGWSSGGQLAAFLATRDTRDDSDPELAGISSKVTCAVAMGGLFDFTFPDAHLDAAEIDAMLLGGTLESPPPDVAYQDFSPISFVDGSSAPCLILQEGSPEIIPYEHSRRMVAALQDAGVQVSYGWFPGTDHGVVGELGAGAPETLAFFARHLAAPQA